MEKIKIPRYNNDTCEWGEIEEYKVSPANIEELDRRFNSCARELDIKFKLSYIVGGLVLLIEIVWLLFFV